MPSKFDVTQFVESDVPTTPTASAFAAPVNRPPTRAELDAKVGDAQARLAELKRAQDELERERAALEEARRRQNEFQTGHAEMQQHLTRGLGLLEEAEFAARRDAEQLAKTVLGLRDALTKVQSITPEAWNRDNWSVELTRALTTLENARMEWNSARLKWSVLGDTPPAPTDGTTPAAPLAAGLPGAPQDFWQLCKLGLALTWPIVLVGGAILAVLLLRR